MAVTSVLLARHHGIIDRLERLVGKETDIDVRVLGELYQTGTDRLLHHL